MPEKNTKKSTVKKTVARKSAAKTTVKKVAKPAETYSCGCHHNCACGGNCAEHMHCKCHKGGFFKKFVLCLIVFALGFASAKLCCCKRGGFMPKPEFDNGCLVVKCPKMAEMAVKMDKNGDGCVDKAEFKVAKKHNRKFKARHQEPEMPAPVPEQVVVESVSNQQVTE